MISFVVGMGTILVTACGSVDESDPASDTSTATAVTSAALDPTPNSPEAPFTEELTVPAEIQAFEARASIQGWDTDFSNWTDTFEVRKIISGGVGRDGIPSIDTPRSGLVSDAPTYLRSEEPVVVVEIDGKTRAYPLSILTWHEITNDELAGVPIAVTFCPLCNTAIAFPRTLNGEVLDFGVSGNLINSNLIMYDRQSQSWWIQATGEAIVGRFAGTQLKFLPAPIVSWADFANQYPEGEVLLRPTASDRHPVTGQSIVRNYERPPYAGYDDINSSPFLYAGALDGRLLPMERVAAITLNDQEIAYPFGFLSENPVINDIIGEEPVVTFFDDGTESAFKTRGGDFSVSGSTTIFRSVSNGKTLTFMLADGIITDKETGSSWTKFGVATGGELAGTTLQPVVHQAHFWFSWAAFAPDTEVRDSVDTLGD